MDEPKEKITLQRDGESILLRKRYVEQKVPLRPCCVRATAGQVRIHIPLKFKRRISTLLNTGGGRILLYEAMLRCEVRGEIIIRRRGYGGQVTPDGLPDFHPDRTAYQKPLVVALARAFRWQKLLDEGIRHQSWTNSIGRSKKLFASERSIGSNPSQSKESTMHPWRN